MIAGACADLACCTSLLPIWHPHAFSSPLESLCLSIISIGATPTHAMLRVIPLEYDNHVTRRTNIKLGTLEKLTMCHFLITSNKLLLANSSSLTMTGELNSHRSSQSQTVLTVQIAAGV